jgi:hypothetical protein
LAILVGENHVFHVEVQVEEQHREAGEMTREVMREEVHHDQILREEDHDSEETLEVVVEDLEVDEVVAGEDESSLVIALTFQNSSTELKQLSKTSIHQITPSTISRSIKN